MGDCRITVYSSRAIVEKLGLKSADIISSSFSVSSLSLSSDTTVRELSECSLKLNGNLQIFSMLDLLQKCEGRLWDCTVYPPCDITAWPLNDFCEAQGSKSKTLYTAGWYPSGVLRILDKHEEPSLASHSAYDDTAFVEALPTNGKVELNGKGGLKPSELLASVAERFGDESLSLEKEAETARQKRHANKIGLLKRQRERSIKLEEKIRKIDANSTGKNKATSRQVRNMLIKSRATGLDTLSNQDRVYFRIVLASKDVEKEDFRFFSRQDTVGKILSLIDVPPTNELELLVAVNEPPVYARLPTLMRVYEAMQQNYLSEINQVIVRQYDSSKENPSIGVDHATETHEVSEQAYLSTPEQKTTPVINLAVQQDVIVDEALCDLLKAATPRGAKKASATATKVHQMKIKSKAKGETKRIAAEKRFFLELLAVEEGRKPLVLPVFGSTSEPLERLLRSCGYFGPYKLLTPTNVEGQFRIVSDVKMTLQNASKNRIIEPFGTLVVDIRNSSS